VLRVIVVAWAGVPHLRWLGELGDDKATWKGSFGHCFRPVNMGAAWGMVVIVAEKWLLDHTLAVESAPASVCVRTL